MLTIESINQDAIDLHLAQMHKMELEIFIKHMQKVLMWNKFIYFCTTGDYPYVADVD